MPVAIWRQLRRGARLALCTLLLAGANLLAAESVEVLTNNYDNARSGANLRERMLSPKNVTPEGFGRVFSYAVDGPVFGQPLVAAAVAVSKGPARDVVYVASGSNSVYAFDAHDGNAPPIWTRRLTQLPDAGQAAPNGILSTPVIDRPSNTIYVVASMMASDQPRFVLHALDLRDGTDKHAGPVIIGGHTKVDEERVRFEPSATRIAVQRAALALAADKVIVAFGGDYFEGWVFAYRKSDLRASPAVFCTTCASRITAISRVDYLDQRCIALGPGGGIWQAGRAPAVDADDMVYFFTGNKQHVIRDGCTIAAARNACAVCSDDGGCLCKGNRSSNVCRGPDACEANTSKDGQSFDTNEALIQLDARNDLALRGWFRPPNWDASGVNGLEVNDLDLGGSGPLLIPNTSRLIGGGKQGVMYVLETAGRSKRGAACVPSLRETCIASEAVQSFQVAPTPPRPNEYFRQILGGPVVWPSSSGNARLFVWRQNDYLRSYSLTDTVVGCKSEGAAPDTSHNCASLAQGAEFIDSRHPGGILAISTNGDDATSGIVWAATNASNTGPAKLMAYQAMPSDAEPETLNKLWDSDACAEDQILLGADFAPPTVANGKVYVSTSLNRVDVYALMANKTCTPAALQPNLGPLLQ